MDTSRPIVGQERGHAAVPVSVCHAAESHTGVVLTVVDHLRLVVGFPVGKVFVAALVDASATSVQALSSSCGHEAYPAEAHRQRCVRTLQDVVLVWCGGQYLKRVERAHHVDRAHHS